MPSWVERWETPDNDFLDIVRVKAPSPNAPALLLLHGLEGSVRSHYVSSILEEGHARGFQSNLLLFRSCGSEMNRQARSYHSGETGDLDWVVSRLAVERGAPLFAVGISLGGNVLLKWLGDHGADSLRTVYAAAAVSPPYDLARSSRHIDSTSSRLYSKRFLRTLKEKALRKCREFPGLASPDAIRKAQTLWEFDDAFTSIVHGFVNAEDYYRKCSSLSFLAQIATPTLLLSARDDPFHPVAVLTDVEDAVRSNSKVEVEFPVAGGHVGFVEGAFPWNTRPYFARRTLDFACQRLPMFKRAPAR